MKKILILFCAMLMLLLALCSCSESLNIDKKKEAVDLTQLKEINKDIDFGDINPNIDTDSQNYFITNSIVSVETGYYYSIVNENNDDILMYYDKDSGISLPVCQRTDCKHIDTSCDACFTSDMYCDEFEEEMWYYNNELYYLSSEKNDESITFILNTLSMDASTRTTVKEVCTLYYDGGSIVSPVVTLHRGYMYYIVSDGEGVSLYKSTLDKDDEPEELCRCDGFYTEVAGVQGFGDGIIFECMYCEEETENILDIQGKIFYYNQNTEEISLITEGIIGGFAVTEDSIVYTDRKDTLMYNISDGVTKILVKDRVADAIYDGKYIYLDNVRGCMMGVTDWSDRKIAVYKTDGTYVDAISPCVNDGISLYGDEDYFFMKCRNADGEYNVYMFDKSQIGIGKHEWMELSFPKY